MLLEDIIIHTHTQICLNGALGFLFFACYQKCVVFIHLKFIYHNHYSTVFCSCLFFWRPRKSCIYHLLWNSLTYLHKHQLLFQINCGPVFSGQHKRVVLVAHTVSLQKILAEMVFNNNYSLGQRDNLHNFVFHLFCHWRAAKHSMLIQSTKLKAYRNRRNWRGEIQWWCLFPVHKSITKRDSIFECSNKGNSYDLVISGSSRRMRTMYKKQHLRKPKQRT